MSDSVVVDWLNENEFRAYPLRDSQSFNFIIAGQSFDISEAILDALLVYSSDPGVPQITGVSVAGGVVTFSVSGQPDFEIPQAGPFPFYRRLPNGSLLVVSRVVSNYPEGSSVTGFYFDEVVVVELDDSWGGVTEVTFTDTQNPVNELIASSGFVDFLDGFQFAADIEEDGEGIRLYAGREYGKVLGCGDYSNATPPEFDCENYVLSINGATADINGVIELAAGGQISVINSPEEHTIYLQPAYRPEDICVPGNSNSELGNFE
jgi:hypothetical protein